jgi:hypothetical protein
MSCQLTMSALDNDIQMLMEARAESEHVGVAGVFCEALLKVYPTMSQHLFH